MKVAQKREIFGDAAADEVSQAPVLRRVVIKVRKDGPLTNLTGIWFLKYGLTDSTCTEERFKLDGATRQELMLLNRKTVFKSYEDFVEKAREDEALAFVLKVTNISKEMFDYVEKHPESSVPLCIDIVKYLKWLKEPDPAANFQSIAKDKRAEFKAVTKRLVLRKLTQTLAGYKAIATITTE